MNNGLLLCCFCTCLFGFSFSSPFVVDFFCCLFPRTLSLTPSLSLLVHSSYSFTSWFSLRYFYISSSSPSHSLPPSTLSVCLSLCTFNTTSLIEKYYKENQFRKINKNLQMIVRSVYNIIMYICQYNIIMYICQYNNIMYVCQYNNIMYICQYNNIMYVCQYNNIMYICQYNNYYNVHMSV